jgi:enoyl-CoA hydratase
MILNAETISPEQARDLGIVDRLYEDAAACRTAAVDYCARLAEGPREAIGRAKVVTSAGFGAPLDLGLALEREAIARVFASDDASEGIQAFADKRPPQFRGR